MSSKLSKSELKGIVKECLVEILKEGIINTSEQPSNSNQAVSTRRSAFDHVSWGEERESHDDINHDYEKTARSLTDNSILAEVLADSQKTMHNQINAERQGKSAMSGDHAERTMAQSDPSDLFSESSRNWAALAFGND